MVAANYRNGVNYPRFLALQQSFAKLLPDLFNISLG
jgi:hypothetical protein